MQNRLLKSTRAPRRKFFYGWYVVAAVWIMLFITSGTGVAIFFKPILDEFGWDRPTLSLASSVAALVFAAIAPFMGRFIDRFGGRAMLFIATATQTLSSLVIGLAPNLAFIYLGRILGIIGYLHPATVLVNRWFVKKRGWALGIVSIGFPMGILVLSPVSQLLVLGWGWRQTLFFWAGVTVILILPLVVFLRNKPEDKGLLPDGEVVSALAHSKSEASARTETGVDLKQTLGTRSFWLLFFAMFICGTSCGLILTHTVIFGTDLGYSEIVAATFLSVQGGVCILGVTLTGRISDRFARNKVLGATFIVRSLSFVVLVVAVVAGGTSLWMLYLGMAFFGFGSFTTAPLSNGLAADLFGNRRMGTIIGILSGAHMIGSAIGTFAGGLTYQLTGNYLIILAVQALVELLAAVFAFLIKKKDRVKAESIIDSRAFQSTSS